MHKRARLRLIQSAEAGLQNLNHMKPTHLAHDFSSHYKLQSNPDEAAEWMPEQPV